MDDHETPDRSPLEQVERLKTGLVLHATGGGFPGENEAYTDLRRRLRAVPTVYNLLPDCVRQSSNLGEFWEFIKHHCVTYQERRAYLRGVFAPVIEYLESNEPDLSILTVAESLSQLSSESVTEVWRKALHRRRHDPEGAITAARTLLETVCKHILDDQGTPYTRTDDLPKLWRLVAEQLKLTPEHHQPTDLKALLGNCQSVVSGLANLRNAVGDAHGQGRRPMKAQPRHAELAVNLAGSMASFLVATWSEQGEPKERRDASFVQAVRPERGLGIPD